MRLPASSLARALSIATLVASLPAAGCSSATTGPLPPSTPRIEGAITPHEVPDADFSASLHRVLRDGEPSAERLGLLVGVVRRQLAHASQRFASGHDAAGTTSVIGALYLLRPGEGRKEMVDASGERALAAAIDRLSSRGDEGRALSLMKMRAAALDPGSPAKVEIEAHLTALDTWMHETRTGGPMRRVGAEERAQVARALADPSDAATEAAATAVAAWIAQALRYNQELVASGKQPDRDEAIEARRAFDSGGATMAALFLRHGDAAGALKRIDDSSAKKVTQAGLYARIKSAAISDGTSARDWSALAAAFSHYDTEDTFPETELDPELRAATVFGTSLEVYRREPTNLGGALQLAGSLVRFGLPEAAPLVLGEALGKGAPLPDVVAAMDLLFAAIAQSAEGDDLDTARRTFQAAGAILAEADRVRKTSPIEPSPARLRSVMAMIEVRAGNLAAARPLFKAALVDEPSVGGFTTLAQMERQAGDPVAALAAVEQALKAPDARVALLDVAEANLTAFELHRDGSAPDRAKGRLDAALASVLAGRQTGGNAATRARAERLLGRILEGYGESKGATRAFERALGAAGTDRPTLGAAMLDAIGRALIRRDLVSARGALKRGLDGDANDDDLAYGGLWVQLLEHELKAAPDGTVERALRAGSKTVWIGKLTLWASGKLSDTDLGAAAQNVSQKVEAAFYTAMARKALGDPGAEQRLRAVAASPVIDLLEVQLARELVAPRVRPDLPGNVQLP